MTDLQDREYDTVERVTMPLLARITTQALDEDYAHVASRRAAAADSGSPARGLSWWTWLAVTVLVGGVLARRRRPDVAAGRRQPEQPGHA